MIIVQCYTYRDAFVLAQKGSNDADRESLCYHYVGGGLTHQPEQTVALLFCGMSRNVADHVCALLQNLARADVDEQVFVSTNRKRGPVMAQWKQEVSASVRAKADMLNHRAHPLPWPLCMTAAAQTVVAQNATHSADLLYVVEHAAEIQERIDSARN